MNLTALQTRAALRYRDPGNREINAAEWTEYLNDTYAEVIASADWPFLEGQTTGLTVSPGSGTVSLPTDVYRVTAVFNATDKIPLAPIPGRADYRHYFPDPGAAGGIPLYYRLRNTTLEVYPWPSTDTSLTVDTVVPPAPLSAGSDEPAFPEQYHRLLVLGALAKAYEDAEGDEARRWAETYSARFTRLLGAMERDLLSPRTESYPPVIDTF